MLPKSDQPVGLDGFSHLVCASCFPVQLDATGSLLALILDVQFSPAVRHSASPWGDEHNQPDDGTDFECDAPELGIRPKTLLKLSFWDFSSKLHKVSQTALWTLSSAYPVASGLFNSLLLLSHHLDVNMRLLPALPSPARGGASSTPCGRNALSPLSLPRRMKPALRKRKRPFPGSAPAPSAVAAIFFTPLGPKNPRQAEKQEREPAPYQQEADVVIEKGPEQTRVWQQQTAEVCSSPGYTPHPPAAPILPPSHPPLAEMQRAATSTGVCVSLCSSAHTSTCVLEAGVSLQPPSPQPSGPRSPSQMKPVGGLSRGSVPDGACSPSVQHGHTCRAAHTRTLHKADL